MKPYRFNHFLAVALTSLVTLSSFVFAADRIKQNNATALNLAGSWDTLPGSGDVAVWDSTVTAANSPLAGASLSWAGIRIANPTGLVTLGGATPTAATTLTIGTSGINMSAATADLIISSPTTVISGNQIWNVASGRNLRFGITGGGAANANVDGSGTITIQGGLVDLNQGGASGFSDAAGFAGFSGKWIVDSGATLRGIRNGATAFGTNTAADTITLNGGTLAPGGIAGAVGNWTWNSNLTLATSTSSTIDNQNISGSGRSLKLMGVFTGSGNLTFASTGVGTMTADTGFIFTAANTNSGTVTLNSGTFLRVGGVTTASDTTLGAGTGGTLGDGSVTNTVVNNGTLTFSRSDAHAVANVISGSGAVRVGGGVTGVGTQVLTLSGASAYTGATTINAGTLNLTGSLSSTPITVAAGATLTESSTGVIGGTSSLTISGSGTLAGANTYTGATTINAGTLNLTGSLTSPVTVNSGAQLRGSGSTTGLLTMAAGSTLVLAGDTATTSVAADGVTFGGATQLLFAATPIASTVYDVFTYGGGVVTDVANLTTSYRGMLTDDTVHQKYIFTSGGVGTRTWNSAVNNGFWDLGFGTNWLEGDHLFFGGDTVVFGDISANAPITLEGHLAPGFVSVNNAANTYTFTGAAGTDEITGSGSLTKNNGGTLAIASQQSYTGGTTINGGLLDLTGTAANGVGIIRGTATVNTGGTLQLSTGDATGYNTDVTRVSVINLVGGTLNVNTIANQTLGSAVISMTSGIITGIAGSNIDLFANGSAINTLASATTSTISLPSMNLRQDNTAFGIADGAAAVDLLISSNLGNGSAGNHNLVKNGAGTMVLSGTNGYTGTTTVSAGTLTVSGTTSATSAVTVNGTGSLLVPTGGSLTATGGLLTAIATGASIVVESGAALTAASATIAWNPATFKIDGALNVTGALTASSNATVPLTGAGTITAGSFVTGNAATVVNYSTAAMNVSGVVNIGSAVATNSNTFNQTAGVITAGGLQLGYAGSTVAQIYTLTGGTLNLGSSGITTAGTGARTVSLGGATVGATAPWSTTLGMALTSTTTGTTFDATGGNISLSGTLSGVGAKLVKSGGGTVILSGANTYTGDTTVNAGVLAVNGSSIANSGKLVVNGGVVDVSGTEVVDTLFFGGAQQAAGTWGSTSSGATHQDNTRFSGTGVVSVTSGPVGGFSTWAAANAGGGTPSGDFDNDGVSNGIEYFMGATGSTFTANPGVVAGKVTWPMDPGYSGTYTVQTSPDLVSWTNVASTVVANTVQYTLPTGAGKVFVRLDVTPN